jgi:IMP dehydrogenase/GMP reductase
MQAQMSETKKKRRSVRLAQLIRIYERGPVSERMEDTLGKLISLEAAEAQRDAEELSADLLKFEERFGMESQAFYKRFEAGELGDDMDYMEWAAFFNMYQHAKERLEALSEA